jgi:hypothetical protein
VQWKRPKMVTWVLLLICLISSCETPAIKPYSLDKDVGLTRDEGKEVLTWEEAHRWVCVSPEDAQLLVNRLTQCEIEEDSSKDVGSLLKLFQ